MVVSVTATKDVILTMDRSLEEQAPTSVAIFFVVAKPCDDIITWRTGAQKYLSQLRFWNFFFVASQPPQNELEPFSPITFGKSRKAFYGYLVSHALNQKLIPIVSSEHALWAPQYGRFGYFYSHWAASWREANQLANVADQKDSLALTCLNFAHRVDAVIQLVGVVW